MSIRIDIEFSDRLDENAGVRLALAVAAIPEVRLSVIAPDRRRATLYTAEMPLDPIRAALAEAGLTPTRVASGLAPDEEAALAAPAGERFRPIGR